ncbi:hypothetical protein HID58_032150 [Brassica napus]|uniref:Uncharacterized protein n=1 Tax=Brassica napus TaxID=3708 RepID=A0ABQ8BVJ4_BRANA|nr:hypothetical protein HID58_032150 [Brassica napus]
MVLCLVKLRRFDEARADLDRVLASSYVPSNNACSLVVDELCILRQCFCRLILYKSLCYSRLTMEAIKVVKDMA